MALGAIQLGKNDQVKVNSSDPAAGFLEDKLESSDNSVTIETDSCNCKIDLRAAPGGYSQNVLYASLDYTDFNQASSNIVINPTSLSSQPAGTCITFFKMNG